MAAAGFLRVVSPDDLAEQERETEKARVKREEALQEDTFVSDLSNYIRSQWEIARDHRSSYGMEQRLLKAMRMFNGEYDPEDLSEIRRFGGSEVFARIVGAKCRAATALLRDIFFSEDRPWELAATPVPDLPEDAALAVERKLLDALRMSMAQGMPPPDDDTLNFMRMQMREEARAENVRKASEEAHKAEDILDDYLVEGGFYRALTEFLIDLPMFPFACIKGPVVRIVPQIKWVDGIPQEQNLPRLFWYRVSPFDLMWTPGVSSISEGDVFERLRWTRKNLHDLLGLPGWNQEAVEAALAQFDGGLRDWMMPADATRATEEGREDPNFNRSAMIDALEFHGSVRGELLRDWGLKDVDDDHDYFVQAWIVGTYVLKVHLSPSPRKRHPYFVTSFDKVPGTVAGNALPDILADIQQVANASLRSLVNNMAMASGPQVVVMDNRTDPMTDTDEIYPWKRWHMNDEPGTSNSKPVDFFQPQSNAQELLNVYQQMTLIADELSAIPRYITGSGTTGGAGRTASGLSMLMGNANKMLHNVVANVDREIVQETIQQLYELVMLTRASEIPLNGDEEIRTRGVSTAMAREAERARQLEFLGVTANPIDMQITGIEGRAAVLRQISRDLGLPGEEVVPSREQFAARAQQALLAQAASTQAGKPAEQAPKPADSTSPRENVVQPRTSLASDQQ